MIEHAPSPRALPGRTSRVAKSIAFLPRFMRLRDAPSYLGMDKNRFNRDVRPHLCAIPIGTQGIAFDRVDLDAWADEYRSRNGRPAASLIGSKPWETKERQACRSVAASGTSTRSSGEHAFARALGRATSNKPKSIQPYPLSVEEQRLLFSELDGHLAAMALFKVNTGLREQEVVNLRWSWEVPVPELDTSVFVIPRSYVKNGLDRYVVLNGIAKSVISERRGEHPEFVFTCGGQPVTKIYNSGWKAARRRAVVRYANELRSACPEGFRSIRVHDLKHTYGHRLRVAGVGFEDRRLLLGHKSDHVTTHYSAPEIGSLIKASEKVCAPRARKSHALTIVRARAEQQVLDFSGGERGTRTLDLGIMSATL
jgi:integrase